MVDDDQTVSDLPSGNAEEWWVAGKKKATGPYSRGYMAASLRSQLISPQQLVCRVGETEWRPVQSWAELQAFLPHKLALKELKASQGRLPAVAEGPTILSRLCSPARTIQLLVVYGTVINPALWLLACATTCLSGTTFAPGTDAQAMEVLLQLAVQGASFLVMVGWIAGGLLLNKLHPRGFWVVIGSYAATWIIGIAFAAAMIGLFLNFSTTETRIEHPAETVVTLFSLILALMDFVLQTWGVVFLIAYRESIPWKLKAN